MFAHALGAVDALRPEEVPLDNIPKPDMVVGIGHTRWATHGTVHVKNAHPQVSDDRVFVVHNGVIDNYAEFKKKLSDAPHNYIFKSETDTEVIAHLLHKYLTMNGRGYDLVTSVAMAVFDLRGKYSFVASDSSKLSIVGYKQGRPLIVFKNVHGTYISSDVSSFQGMDSGEIYFLHDGEIVSLHPGGEVKLFNSQPAAAMQEKILRWNHYVPEPLDATSTMRTIMEAEIFQQPASIESTSCEISIKELDKELSSLRLPIFTDTRQLRVKLLGCGTSYHAALLGARWLTELAGVDATAEISSEFASSPDPFGADVYVLLSQSGETADTLSALDRIEQSCDRTISICNVDHSELVRRTKLFIPLRAGVERSVASTKAFTAQLIALLKLSIALGTHLNRGVGSLPFILQDLTTALELLPGLVNETLSGSKSVKNWAAIYPPGVSCALFLGRGGFNAVMHEGALKLAEIAYVPSLAYTTGELKHGPLALIGAGEPVYTAISRDEPYREKAYSALKQVESRGGRIYMIAEEQVLQEAVEKGVRLSGSYTLPSVKRFDNLFSPILATIPLQLLAHEVALVLGNSVDMPRNLAKSVTVE